jgi:hypothetical protein
MADKNYFCTVKHHFFKPFITLRRMFLSCKNGASRDSCGSGEISLHSSRGTGL